MTQQYIVGELSVLIEGLSPDDSSALAVAVRDVQHRLERAALSDLVPLVREAVELADSVCWRSLEVGDADGFSREATRAACLCEFAACAGLLA
jgi:hypothetical protein